MTFLIYKKLLFSVLIFCPTDLVNTKTTIPLRVGEQRLIYTSTLHVSCHFMTPFILFFFFFFFFQILAFSKPSSNQICVEISQLKDAERGPLNYLGGYILHNLYRNHLSKASKKTNICQGKKQFLLNSLHIDEPRYQGCSILLVPKIGEICGTLRNTWQIFLHSRNTVLCRHWEGGLS